jgi:ATP-dependent Lhr-like helicase
MEARGEIRGGRFVSGFLGEQFARPEAVDLLRASRRRPADAAISVSAADPLNLAGIILPGSRVSPLSGEIVEIVRPVPIETLPPRAPAVSAPAAP